MDDDKRALWPYICGAFLFYMLIWFVYSLFDLLFSSIMPDDFIFRKNNLLYVLLFAYGAIEFLVRKKRKENLREYMAWIDVLLLTTALPYLLCVLYSAPGLPEDQRWLCVALAVPIISFFYQIFLSSWMSPSFFGYDEKLEFKDERDVSILHRAKSGGFVVLFLLILFSNSLLDMTPNDRWVQMPRLWVPVYLITSVAIARLVERATIAVRYARDRNAEVAL